MRSSCNNFDILEESLVGYVSVCRHCDEINVKIGTFFCKINESSFRGLCAEFKARKKDFQLRIVQSHAEEHILFAISSQNLFISLNEEEFYETCEMLQVAQYMLSVNEILSS